MGLKFHSIVNTFEIINCRISQFSILAFHYSFSLCLLTFDSQELRHTINEIKSKLNVSTSTQKTFRDNLPTTTMTDNLIRIGAEKLIDPFRNHQPVEPELEALNEVSEPPDFEANNRADELVLLTEKPKIVGRMHSQNSLANASNDF